jgi:hypothetical protein
MARGLCDPCYQKHQRQLHPERYREFGKRTRTVHREKFRAAIRRWNLKNKFGITVEQYDAMLAAQGGLCALCHRHERTKAKRLAVDHDHATGAVRGLLCGPCNVVLGYIENTEWFPGAIDYINEHKRKRSA